MGLARDLSMGPARPRGAGIARTGDWARLRRLTATAAPDVREFRAVLDRVAALPGRRRYAEGVVYLNACARYRALTGEDYGPRWGTY